MSRRVWVVMLVLSLACPAAFPQRPDEGGDDHASAFFNIGGSADWGLFRSDGRSQGTRTSLHTFGQRYSLDADGAIWDARLDRYALGLDFFRADQKLDGQEIDSQTVGYRATTTFFPSRAFPLRLFARRSATDAMGVSLADSDRETAAWGVEWNVAARRDRTLRTQFDRTAYDLLSPVALLERRSAGTVEFSERSGQGEISARYGLNDERELVRGSGFKRQGLAVEDRTRFDGGSTLLVNGSRTRSDAEFASGESDRLTVDRVSGIFDLPRASRVGFNLSYDFNRNDGKFVNSTSHGARALVRFPAGERVEWDASAALGRLGSTSGGVEITEDLAGLGAGVRWNRDWIGFHLGTTCALGVTRTRFSVGPDRTVTSGSLDLEARVPFEDGEQLFVSADFRKDQNDTTGVGYTLDEARGTLGVEGDAGESLRWRGSAYVRGNRYDTFQFGLQTSREVGAEGSLTGASGGASFGGSVRRGVSDFVPDPASGSPFTPGNDLVNRSRSFFAGANWRFSRRLQVRAQARLESREFTSIGRERVLSYHPEVEWNWTVWRVSLTLSHYERNNETNFSQDTLFLKISRLLF